MAQRLCALVLCVAALGAHARAQDFETESITSIGVRVKVHKKLKAVPVQPGDKNIIELHQRAHFEPRSRDQSIMKDSQPFNWGMEAYLFEEPPTYKDQPTDQDEIRRRAIEKRKFESGARNFADFVKSKDPRSTTRKFHGKGGDQGTAVKGKRGMPDYVYWEYSNEDSTQNEPKFTFSWYFVAAAYRIDKREVALVFSWPIFKDKPDPKYLAIGKEMVESLQVEADTAAKGGDDKKAEFANTPERQKTLATATASIGGVDGWDWFTTPGCLTLYSWPPASADKAKKAREEAAALADHLTAMQERYAELLPKHEKMGDSWPVLRVFFDRHTFRLYGRPPLHAESTYDPANGEIVVMQGGDEQPRARVGAEGFRHWATAWFSGNKLSPWFETGMAEWFGCWTRAGARWTYEPNKLRVSGENGAKSVWKHGANAKLAEVLGWVDAKFVLDEENKDAPAAIAQAYSLADFLQRGAKGARWDPAWSDLVPSYVKALGETRNAAKASAATFGAVDAGTFEAAWGAWVETSIQQR